MQIHFCSCETVRSLLCGPLGRVGGSFGRVAVCQRVLRRFRGALLCTTMLVSHVSAQVTLLGNLGQTSTNASVVIGNNSGNDMVAALSFTMPSTSYTLSSVTLRLSGYGSGAADSPAVGIYSDNSGTPGTLVGSLLTNPSPNDGSEANFTFTATSATTLVGSTTYWLKVDEVGTGQYLWRGSNPYSIQPSGEATYGVLLTSPNSGSTWPTNVSAVVPNLRPTFEITATSAIPEPSTYAMWAGAIGLLGSFIVRRRRSQR